MYQKLYQNNKIAVLVSPRYGSGWYTWNTAYEGLLFDRDLVEAVLEKNINKVKEIANEKYPGVYTGGARDLEVQWLEPGTYFRIEEYDGWEKLITYSNDVYFKA